MLNKYEKSAARCLRAADQVNDAVLRFGFRNMARAWLDLAKKKMPRHVGSVSLRRLQSQRHTRSGRVTDRSRSTSPMMRRSKSSPKIAAKRRVRSH
jgi:hypothetical protein